MSILIPVIATGLLNDIGEPINSGSLLVVATDDRDKPIPYRIPGMGVATESSAYRFIKNGAITAPLLLPDPTQTDPQNIRFRFVVIDVNHRETYYRQITPVINDGVSFNFSSWMAGQQTLPPPTGGSTGTGNPADGSVIVTATSLISANTAIAMLDGVPTPADASNLDHAGTVLGVAINSGQAGDPITVRFDGLVTSSGWHWQPAPVLLGRAGQLTQTSPSSGFFQEIGTPINPTTLLVRVRTPRIFA